jgi:hypothetical protein
MIPFEELIDVAQKRIKELENFCVEAFPSTERERQNYKEQKFKTLLEDLTEEYGRLS